LSRFYYRDVSLPETLRRHATRPEAADVHPDQIRDWYRPQDLLKRVREHVIPEASAVHETTALILADTRLDREAPRRFAELTTRPS